jgi:patatin-like phospholipase/acyl hydrolase
MIAGTSSGGLITAMITTPKGDTIKDPPFPTCNAEEVVKFFEKDAVKIFSKKLT